MKKSINIHGLATITLREKLTALNIHVEGEIRIQNIQNQSPQSSSSDI